MKVLLCLAAVLYNIVPAAAQPWSPPKTTLPSSFLKTVQTLLVEGFGDPRGGVYSSVMI